MISIENEIYCELNTELLRQAYDNIKPKMIVRMVVRMNREINILRVRNSIFHEIYEIL